MTPTKTAKTKPATVWFPAQIAKLKKLYPVTDTGEVAKTLGMTERAIRSAAKKFGIEKSDRYWTREQVATLEKMWADNSAVEIGKKLSKTRWAVINKYREVQGLRKSNNLI